MKLSILKDTLETVLSNFQAFLNKRDSSQITSHIFFQTIDNKLLLRATDFEISIQTQIDVIKIEEEGEGTVNGEKIFEIIKRLDNEKEILFSIKNEILLIQQEKTEYELPMFNPGEFPKFPSYNTNTKIQISSSQFIEAIKRINPAVGINNPKMELNGAYIDIKEYSINIVATDTRRLAFNKYDSQSVSTLSMIIPKKGLNEIQKLCIDEVELFYNETQLIIKTGIYLFSTKLTNGKFPDYERIIPKEFTHTLELPTHEFIKRLKLVNPITNDIKIIFRQNEIIFETLNSDNSEKAKTQFEIQTKFEDEFVLGINSKNLLDFLEQIMDEKFTFCINESNNPFMVKSENFSTIVMPVIF